ncbi:hypothetical protein E2C01_085996 [Portunus trituberculatus]|uniref:Uncharacterized protein n=1 Tax=Portunus trituberculatus TaxID=210409 RepID=A0A5B7JDF3_PORTR|nr:hypothetical protein [Portunus trituberculatus]
MQCPASGIRPTLYNISSADHFLFTLGGALQADQGTGGCDGSCRCQEFPLSSLSHYGTSSELIDRSSGRTETTPHSTHRENEAATPRVTSRTYLLLGEHGLHIKKLAHLPSRSLKGGVTLALFPSINVISVDFSTFRMNLSHEFVRR